MKTANTSKSSTIKNILNSAAFLPLVFFITSVLLWGAFISKVYYEDQTNHIIDSLSENVITTNRHTIRNDKQASKRIEVLTKELKEQQQRNMRLKIQIEEEQSRFKVMIDQSVASASSSDREYLKVLKGVMDNKHEKAGVVKVDYSNRVEVNSDTYKNSDLQQKINQLLPISPDETYSTYMREISSESKIKKNEVRSIVFKSEKSI